MEQQEIEDSLEINQIDLKEFIAKLSPKDKIRLLIKYFGEKMFGSILAIITEEISKDSELLRQVGLMLKSMQKNGELGKDEKCKKVLTDGFQAVINFYFAKFGLKVEESV